MICKRLCKYRRRCGYIYYLLNKHKVFHLLGLCLQRFMEHLCTTHPTVIAFMVRDIIALNSISSIFPLAGLIKLMVYLQICHWRSKQVFYRTKILFFILIPRYGCFGVTYVSRSVELNFCLSECHRFIKVYSFLRFKFKFKTFFKSIKWSFNTLSLSLSQKKNIPPLN